ncbi:MAG: hypothetical protein WAV11_01865 [Minisyncoccia bacterium]
MKKLIRFFSEMNEVIRNRADDKVADYHGSVPSLMIVGLFWLVSFVSSIGCLLIAITSIFGTASYPWYILPGALFSPYLVWLATHAFISVNQRLARF